MEEFVLRTGVDKFSKNLGVITKFCMPEWLHQAVYAVRAHWYLVPLYKIKSFGICAPLLKKLIVVQIVKTGYRIHSSPPSDRVFSHINPVHIVIHYIKISFNIITFPKCHFPFRILLAFLISCMDGGPPIAHIPSSAFYH